jgi:hypothetical protein
MIVKIGINYTDGESHFMMFGDSYKNWDEQASEYLLMWRERIESVGKVFVSKSKWVGYGGLKWCREDNFQEQLDTEPVEKKRQFSEMEFTRSSRLEDKVEEIFRKYKTKRA